MGSQALLPRTYLKMNAKRENIQYLLVSATKHYQNVIKAPISKKDKSTFLLMGYRLGAKENIPYSRRTNTVDKNRKFEPSAATSIEGAERVAMFYWVELYNAYKKL